MNKYLEKRLNNVVNELSYDNYRDYCDDHSENDDLRVIRNDYVDMLRLSIEELEAVRDDLQDIQDNTPENLENSEAYYNRDNALSNLDDVISNLEDSMSDLEAWLDKINGDDDCTNFYESNYDSDFLAELDEIFYAVADAMNQIEYDVIY